MRQKPIMSVERACQTCGTPIRVRQSYIRKGGGKFCGRDCYIVSISQPRMPVQDRLWPLTDRSGGPESCWPFHERGRNPHGYGKFQFKDNGRVRQLAHQAAWVVTFGSIPDGLGVLHKCDNPPCCNPAHLFLGTSTENNADRHRKGRSNGPRGEAHPRAKLTAATAREIRARQASGIPATVLGTEYGVGQTTILDIWNGKRWPSSI